jgi:hypothetical protein
MAALLSLIELDRLGSAVRKSVRSADPSDTSFRWCARSGPNSCQHELMIIRHRMYEVDAVGGWRGRIL